MTPSTCPDSTVPDDGLPLVTEFEACIHMEPASVWFGTKHRLGPDLCSHTNDKILLRWRHNGRDSVSNQQPHDCLLNRLFSQSSASLAFVRGSHRVPVNSPHKWPVTRKMFPFDDAILSPNQSYALICYSSVRHPNPEIALRIPGYFPNTLPQNLVYVR